MSQRPSPRSSPDRHTLPPEPDLLADDDALFLIGVNVDHLTQALTELDLPAIGAFALWLPNETEFMEATAVSVCSAEVWTERLAALIAAPDPEAVAVALDPQSWDHPEIDLGGYIELAAFDAASARLYDRFGDERNPSAQVLDETARRLAQAPPLPVDDLLVAMATDGSSDTDEVLESIRYASPSASVAALEAAGLPQSYWDLL